MSDKIFSLDFRKSLFALIVIVIIAAIIGFFFTEVYLVSSIGLNSKNCLIGKNHVKFNLTEPFYVRDLIRWNPSISVVSYVEDNKTIGYVNLFNGIGENFIIEDNKNYEIISNKDVSLFLPTGVDYIIKEV